MTKDTENLDIEFNFFKIFINNPAFCLKEKKIEIYCICNYIKENKQDFHSLFIIINEGTINFQYIKQILQYQLIMEG